MVDQGIHVAGGLSATYSPEEGVTEEDPTRRCRDALDVMDVEDAVMEASVLKQNPTTASDFLVSDDTDAVDQSGRVLGPRALQTRQRILDATVAELGNKSMRDLRVIDVARRVGSSPATFYQYFKDIEDVVLHLAEQVTRATPLVIEMIRGDWSGPLGFERSRQFVQLSIDYWIEVGPILRVRNNAANEGDPRFGDLRLRAITPMIDAMAFEIEAAQKRAIEAGEPERDPSLGRMDARAAALVGFALLDRTAMNYAEMKELGATHDAIVDSAAILFHSIMTGGRS